MAALHRTTLLDSPPSESFDALTRLAARALQAPVALVSLVDTDRQFFKSQVGLPEPWAAARETPLTHSFCQWVVSDQAALVVSDAREHPVLRTNRALFDLGVVAYAGVPLTGTTGQSIGSSCAIDSTPRVWTDDEVAFLRDLSTIAEACIAAEEFVSATKHDAGGLETTGVARSLMLRALGEGVSASTKILGRGDLRIGDAERKELLKLTEWLGRNIVRLATG